MGARIEPTKAIGAMTYARLANHRRAAIPATTCDPPLCRGFKNLVANDLPAPSKPPSEDGDGNTSLGAMAEKRQYEKKISPLHLKPSKHQI